MKRVGLILDGVFERHDTGPGHPERRARIRAVRDGLLATELVKRCLRVEPCRADDEQLLRVHPLEHIQRIERAVEAGAGCVDSTDTTISRHSAEVARLAAGSVATLAVQVAQGIVDSGFAAVRPPGHHAERDLAMGFCLYNNVAIAVEHLRATGGVRRVLICDWDVHHGNGTQHLFEEDPDVFFFSLHQWPLYPGTGARDEVGRGAGHGSTLNHPLAPGSGDVEFLAALKDDLVPAGDRFRPEIVFISAGFDAHRDDPLGGLLVSTEAYGQATRVVLEAASRWCGGRVVSVLEGGYDLPALAGSAAAHVAALLGD